MWVGRQGQNCASWSWRRDFGLTCSKCSPFTAESIRICGTVETAGEEDTDCGERDSCQDYQRLSSMAGVKSSKAYRREGAIHNGLVSKWSHVDKQQSTIHSPQLWNANQRIYARDTQLFPVLRSCFLCYLVLPLAFQYMARIYSSLGRKPIAHGKQMRRTVST